MQEPEGEHGGDRQSIWSIPKSEQATSSASSSSADLFRRTGLSRLPRDPGAENRGERNGHHRPHGRYQRGRRRIVAGDRRGRETIHGGSKIHRGKIPEPPQGNLRGFGFALVERFDWTEALTRRDLRIENEERWIWTNSTQSRRFCRIVSRLRWIAKQIREIDFKEVCSCNNGWRS